MDLFRINIDIDNLSEEALRYLYSSKSAGSLFRKRDQKFLRDTLGQLRRTGAKDGCQAASGGLLHISSALPEQPPKSQEVVGDPRPGRDAVFAGGRAKAAKEWLAAPQSAPRSPREGAFETLMKSVAVNEERGQPNEIWEDSYRNST